MQTRCRDPRFARTRVQGGQTQPKPAAQAERWASLVRS
jgi:hypothetical protein